MAVFTRLLNQLTKGGTHDLQVTLKGHAQAIGVGLVSFEIRPFDSFMKWPRMSQADTKCESYRRYHQVGFPNRQKKEDMTCVGLAAFLIYPFDILWPFLLGGQIK